MRRIVQRRAYRVLGAALWIAAAALIGLSVWNVQARAARPRFRLHLKLPSATALTAGDAVFLSEPSGLRRIGEVAAADGKTADVSIDLRPDAMAGLNASTRAECWRTPLSVEDALNALLPETIQERIIEHVARDWQAREADLEAVWRPILTELASAYIDLVAEDFRRALDVREDVLLQTATDAAARARTHWPEVQRRLNPIIQEHLTPVLSRLMDEALDQAPKARIAWYLYRNNSREAFNLLLEWQTRFMVELPEKDRQEVAQAFRDTWRAAAEDEELVERVKALGRELRDDPQIIHLLEDIYRETISDNPKTAEFLRQAILKSPQIQQEFYRLIEWFAPTARQVTALCLFDESGATRPEIVHLLRSIALRRQMAWVTLITPGAGPDLAPGATLPVGIRGGT